MKITPALLLILDLAAGRVRWGRGVALPLAAGSLCLWAAAQSKFNEWLTFGAFVVAGTLLYALAALARREKPQP